MGTSQSFCLKSTPNWSSAKRAVTNIAKGEGDNSRNCANCMTAMSHALRGSLYRGERAGGGRGGRSSFGRAGAKTVNNFVSLVNSVRSGGLVFALGLDQIPEEHRPLTKEDFIDEIIRYVTGENDSTIDDGASACAMRKVLIDILQECENVEDIEAVLRNADEDRMASWIIKFEVEYILEFAGVIFQDHIFSKSGNPETVLGEIRRWLNRELDNRFAEEMRQVDFNSQEGKVYIDELTSKILDLWQ